MKDIWIERYMDAAKMPREPVEVLTAFNANIDEIHRYGELELDEEVGARHIDRVSSREEFDAELNYGFENSVSEEVDLEIDVELKGGKDRLGGQAGIMSNFLALQENSVIFYTPFLSQQLADMMHERILSPAVEGRFVLKNVRDAANTDRTKRNIIVEYDSDRTGRVIFSQKMKGFGPYFRKAVEDNLDQLEENVDRAIFSGYHDVDGNVDAKLEKARQQLEKISIPIHLEYVHREGTTETMLDKVLPEVDSIGLDEEECLKLSDKIGVDVHEDLTLGDAFNIAKNLIHEHELSRVHIHTYRYHVSVTERDYSVQPEKIRKSMLYGEAAALATADKGAIANKQDMETFDMDEKHLHRLDELEDFQHFFDLHDFPEKGIAEIKGLNVVAIPTIIHEAPKRLVGLGDIISSAAFTAEIS
jgi:ADP-dependent phosphofructokinase/glucokinase